MASSSLYSVSSAILLLVLVQFGRHGEVTGQCLEHQKSLLVRLNQSVMINDVHDLYRRTFKWDVSKDCCSWPGVACNGNGYVDGLDLSYEGITLGLNNTSPLFGLQHLISLNLAGNYFHWMQGMSSGFERLVSLMNLDMSFSHFFGKFPVEISNLTRLVTLDLSYCVYPDFLESPINFGMLVGNLSKLTQIHLDSVNYMDGIMEWSKVVSSSLSHLQILSLNRCGLSGPIDVSFQNLTYLSNIDLRWNDFKIPFPAFFSKFKYLTSLRISNSGFTGKIPDSLGELTMLSIMDLSANKFEGVIPESISKLKYLSYLDLSYNILTGSVPSLSKAINLTNLALGGNQLVGSMLDTNWGDLLKLEHIDVSRNSLTGSIPFSLFGIPSLMWLDVSSNLFVNFTNEPVSTSSSQLKHLILAHNHLQGPFPPVIFGLQALQMLDLQFNKFSETFYMDSLRQLKNLSHLTISYNNFSVDLGEDLQIFSRLSWIGMASCNLKAFPEFIKKSNRKIIYLDLSVNHIHGEIPRWIWDSLDSRSYLNLSHNQLQTFETQVSDHQYYAVQVLDISYNKFYGKIPMFGNLHFLDLSGNFFNSTVFTTLNKSDISNLRVSNNFLRGSIPKSLCNSRLYTLDLSSNFLSGILPSCLLQMERLTFLNLKNNSISGTIPDLLQLNCTLETMILNGNSLQGTIPKSLGKCESLNLLDLGNNKLHDVFPCWMSNISALGALVLSSNMLHGSIACPSVNWPNLQILDIASNNFSGKLPSRQLLSWKAMLVNDSTSQHRIAKVYINDAYDFSHYGVIVTLVWKGTRVTFSKVLSSLGPLKLIDLSDNMFEGTIPDELGYFTALHLLNISHNNMRGQIPPSLGRMQNLESLDLRNNELTGNIPQQLANLNFLSVLNLSFNKLEGKIPNGGQLQTFSEYSFLHNEGLCGLPLNTSCDKKNEGTPLLKPSYIFEGEVLISPEVGFAVGLGFIIMPLIFWPEWRKRFYEFIDKVLVKILCR